MDYRKIYITIVWLAVIAILILLCLSLFGVSIFSPRDKNIIVLDAKTREALIQSMTAKPGSDTLTAKERQDLIKSMTATKK